MAEQRVPDDAIVLRGGVLDIRDIREQAEDEFRRCGTYSISTVCAPGRTLEETARIGRRPNRLIRKTTAGRLRERGFKVAPPQLEISHSNLIMAEQRTVTEEDWSRLDAAFDEGEDNPFLS